MNTNNDFNNWAFEQCVIKGDRIDSVKNDKGVNIAWINTTTKERFNLLAKEEIRK